MLDRWVWRVESAEGVTPRDAATGGVFQFSEELMREIAQRHYAGEGSLKSVTFHSTPTLETRDSPSTWEARFDDENATSLYFAADDGRLVETRNDTWRLFDFFWMLHTMDYRGRDNFNNPAGNYYWLCRAVAFALGVLAPFSKLPTTGLRVSHRLAPRGAVISEI